MPYTRVNWVDGAGGGTPIDAANLNTMDAYIATLDTDVTGSQTPAQNATPAASGSVATLLSYIVSQLLLIGGGANWYSAPAETLAALHSQQTTNTSNISALSGSKANKSGDTFSGQVYVVAPDILAAGHQESGFCGIYNGTPSSGQFYGCPVNFKTQLTNNPSSITLSMGIRNSGSSSTFADVWSVYGFRIVAKAASSAVIDVAGTYTTVGNCLLAVDEAAQTFDHHCDGRLPNGALCGAVHRALPLAALDSHDGYASEGQEQPLTFTCPECGATETFWQHFTSADEADTTPQGTGEFVTTRGEQARLIRALMRLRGLPVAA